MPSTRPVTYARIAEVLTDLGMITEEKARAFLADFADYLPGQVEPGYEVADLLESFGVAVAIHTDDVDFADAHYEWLLNEAAALTGGKVTVTNYRFDKDNPDDEDCGLGTMHFECDGKPVSIMVEQESNDYLDMGAARDAIAALNPPDDPRDFRCVEQKRSEYDDDIMVLATAEQRDGLREHLGITFEAPWA